MMSRSEHLRTCVSALNLVLKGKDSFEFGLPLDQSHEAIFELIDQGWDEEPPPDEWREGYEQCLMDICEAVALEWGVELPPRKEKP
jgi:hypothetical protein